MDGKDKRETELQRERERMNVYVGVSPCHCRRVFKLTMNYLTTSCCACASVCMCVGVYVRKVGCSLHTCK